MRPASAAAHTTGNIMAFDKPPMDKGPSNYLTEPAVRTLPDEDITRHQPAWFREAISAPRESRRLTVDGASIHYLRWGNDDPGRPGILFVHGNGAHAYWFAFIAPLLAHRYNVAAMDLGGMGDSDWREHYSRESFAREIGEVALAAGLGPKPVVVGHSFGGFVTLIAGKHYGDRLGGLILCDFSVRPPEDAHEWFLEGPLRRPTRIYPDYETAKARFRLAPLQPCANGFIIDYIGGLSLCEVKAGENPGRRPSAEAGWTWKFDAELFNGLRMGADHAGIYSNLACKGATMFGLESKDYAPHIVADLKRIAPEKPVFTIPGAQHHIMLDQPHAFAATVGTLMAQWEAEGALGPARA
jgi:pimeloyl-ACP methyl ester carboxylesterase